MGTPAVDVLLKQLSIDFDSLESKLAEEGKVPTYDDVLPELERMESGIEYAWGVAGHLNGVKNGDELRAAYEENQPKVIQATTKLSQSKLVYDALSIIQKDIGGIDDENMKNDEDGKDIPFEVLQKRRSVDNSLRGMTLSGVGLEGEQKERYNEMRMRIADLS